MWPTTRCWYFAALTPLFFQKAAILKVLHCTTRQKLRQPAAPSGCTKRRRALSVFLPPSFIPTNFCVRAFLSSCDRLATNRYRKWRQACDEKKKDSGRFHRFQSRPGGKSGEVETVCRVRWFFSADSLPFDIVRWRGYYIHLLHPI